MNKLRIEKLIIGFPDRVINIIEISSNIIFEQLNIILKS